MRAPAPQLLDLESRSWLDRLVAAEPARGKAIAELHEWLRREAAFHIRSRVLNRPDFPRSDIDDLAVQAADDALIAILRKLGDYRGDSQFLTWARRFAALEAPVSIRRRLGHDRVGISKDPDNALLVADPAQSVPDRAEARELLRTVSDLMVEKLTTRQRTVLTRVAMDGASASTVAVELHTSRGAIYKSLHDARVKLRAQLAA
jgi:RNA polymerase sigma-70 factor, ECF subfamily